jgi:hypothetical protein
MIAYLPDNQVNIINNYERIHEKKIAETIQKQQIEVDKIEFEKYEIKRKRDISAATIICKKASVKIQEGTVLQLRGRFAQALAHVSQIQINMRLPEQQHLFEEARLEEANQRVKEIQLTQLEEIKMRRENWKNSQRAHQAL